MNHHDKFCPVLAEPTVGCKCQYIHEIRHDERNVIIDSLQKLFIYTKTSDVSLLARLKIVRLIDKHMD